MGALELLTERLGLPAAERTELLGWHARHVALYRIDTMAVKDGVFMTMNLHNLINEQPYRARIEMSRARLPFQNGNMVFGGLVPWRGEWYWSGSQQRWTEVPDDFPRIKREFFQRSALITYRYCPERAAKARRIPEEHHLDFVRFHGANPAVFPDGLALAAAEQRRMRDYIRSRTGRDDASTPGFPPEAADWRHGVAVFSQPGEGQEIMHEFDVLVRALQSDESRLSDDQANVLQGFVESTAISPAFVRRVIAQHGSRGLVSI